MSKHVANINGKGDHNENFKLTITKQINSTQRQKGTG